MPGGRVVVLRRPARWSIGLGVLCWLSFAGLLLAPAAQGRGALAGRLWQGSVPAPAPGDTVRLAHRLVEAASLQVWQGPRRFLPGIDYEAHAARGYMVWLAAAPSGSELEVLFRYLDLDLPMSWSLTRRRAAADTVRAAAPILRDRELPAGARIQVGGSKTFALEFGNRQDVSLTQSLDLTLRGQLAPDVEVRAVLTDRNLPLQPEGTSAELSDLDKVFIEVRSPWGLANLGDIRVAEDGLRFLSHRREMEGVLVRAGKVDTPRGAAAVGRSVGVSRSIRLVAQDGKQGPYVLVSRDPAKEEVLVAGSERVWMDGEQLRRGEDADYTVDYAAGELWFTPRRPVMRTQEVRVDVQVRQGGFDRGYYWAQSAAGDPNRGVALAYLREADDPDRSPLVPIGEQEREALAAAGDSASALESGIRYVGPGLAPYERVEVDSLVAPIFVYLGADPSGAYRGSYEVAFTRVEDGRGEYQDSTLAGGETIYVYRGYRQADFVPGRLLPLPESRDVMAIQGRTTVGADLALEAEAAFSWHDQNVLSPKDDEDNDGQALFLGGRLTPLGLFGGSRRLLELSFELRNVSRTYSSPEPLDAAFYYRRWNADPSVLDGRDRRRRLGLLLRPRGDLSVSAEYEQVVARERFRGNRWTVRAERAGRVHGHMQVRLSRSRADAVAGNERALQARLGWRGPIQLTGEYETEDLRRGASGQERGRSYERVQGTGLYERPGSGLAVRGEAQWRWDYDRAGGRRMSDGLGRSMLLGSQVTRERWTADLLLSHRSQDGPNGQSSATSLANWTVETRSAKRLLVVRWQGNLTAEEALLRTERLVEVTPGGGHYDSLGHYVGIGDYEFYQAPADSALETRFETALRISLFPLGGWLPAEHPWSKLETRVYGRVDMGTPQPVGTLLGSAGSLLRGAGPVRRHNGLLRIEVARQGSARVPAPRLRFEQRRHVDRNETGFQRERLAHDLDGEIQWTARPGLTWIGGAGYLQEEEATSRAAPTPARSFDRHARRDASLESRWALWGPLTTRGRFEAGWDRFEPGGRAQQTREATAGLIADLKAAGRFEAVVTRNWISSYEPTARLFADRRPGWRATLHGSVRPRPGYSVTLSLRMDQREGHSRVIAGKMEMRAFF